MKFTISAQRALQGNDIDIQIEADGDEVIAKVAYNLDGFSLDSNDFTQNPLVFFQRTFSQAGDAGPRKLHQLIVQVEGLSEQPTKYASKIWNDLT